MSSKSKAKRTTCRHTQHGLDKSNAKSRKKIASLGTERNYSQAYSTYLDWCARANIHPDLEANATVVKRYLEERSKQVRQKTLDQDRQALQFLLDQKFPYIISQRLTTNDKRSYTLSQMNAIASHQDEKNSITTLLANHSGVRAHEPATILRRDERSPSSHREWDPRRFLGSPEYQTYTVIGKGGLVREIAVPLWLAEQLEDRRISSTRVTDRGIYYASKYDIGLGQAWSQSFSAASNRALGFSTGGHGLRHSFAKRRLQELITALELINPNNDRARIYQDALLLLSQELGHFRPEIVLCYLR